MLRHFIVGLFALALSASSTAARASTIQVTAPNDIRNDGLLDWSVLGTSGTIVSNSFTTDVIGISGLTITGAQDAGHDFERWDEGSAGWNGNFTPGDHLLFTGDNPSAFTPGWGPMSFLFNAGVTGFGTHIQQEFFGPFTAEIAAYNASNVLIGRYTADGAANNGRNSALFLGIASDASDIWRVTLNVIAGTNEANNRLESFAINAPRIQGTLGDTTATPEPASLVLLGTGILAGLRTAARRRR